MKRPLVAAAILLLFASVASAQPQVPRGGAASRPTYSPYLNLLGGGFGSPGLNYLGIVRPQMQLNQQFNQIQQQLTTQNQSINDAIQMTQEAMLPPTGNVSVFNSTGGYFNRIPGVTAGGGLGGASGGFSRPLGAYGGGLGGGGAGGAQMFGRSTSSRGGSGGVRR